MSNPIAIKEVVREVIQGLTSDRGVNKQDIAHALNAVLDKKTLRHIKTERYDNNKLMINVNSSAWLYKLNLEKQNLLVRLNAVLHRADIKELVFKMGNV